MTHYSIEPKTRTYVKGYIFLPLASNISDIFRKMYWIMLKKQD